MTKCDLVCHQCGMDSDDIVVDYDNLKCPYCGSCEIEIDVRANTLNSKIAAKALCY
ncbi:MAG: hypothetical protein HN929_02800 [Chloroflexi bacterium]|jgi:hypothetical protein|nr:hypothetical protein [Chloroflexota bacterium]MBT7080389.1 hypothetical protein [Chloroflexota bacterium]MBT7289442.1 hypothetical protein [Chloroflexota bacterium]